MRKIEVKSGRLVQGVKPMIILKKQLMVLILQFFAISFAYSADVSTEQSKVLDIIKEAENYIKTHGKEKAILEFKKKFARIFMCDYSGNFYLSPLHPELIGPNQFNYKDDSGAFPVQEEIEQAKAGGGWLKPRWRKDPEKGKYQCRKIYVLPIPGDYLIGSWYNYPPNKNGDC
ncbi:MAG: cache domain-containing protein [Gammaproteobacteria bacterium]